MSLFVDDEIDCMRNSAGSMGHVCKFKEVQSSHTDTHFLYLGDNRRPLRNKIKMSLNVINSSQSQPQRICFS